MKVELRVETVGVPLEACPGEARVALVPASMPALSKGGLRALVQAGAGERAGFSDEAYRQKGATIVPTRADAFAADVVVQVRTPSACAGEATADLELLRPDQVVIGLCNPLSSPGVVREMAGHKPVVFALELMPRITRAQAMDVLSSQATLAGYKAVLLAAVGMPKMFPLLTTAAGTVAPARVLVIGAGVAGLQAIATARRLGAVVEAYDVRPAVKEEVESLGARFLELPLQPGDAQDASGYAKALGEQFYARQRELLTAAVAGSNAVITTALIPGKPAPVLVTRQMVEGMAPGSVIVDLASEQGGNCELTRPDQEFVHSGVTIMGPTNLPSTLAHDASQMYAKNVTTFLLHLVKEGNLAIDSDDEIVAKTLVARGGEVVNAKVLEALDSARSAPADEPSVQEPVRRRFEEVA